MSKKPTDFRSVVEKAQREVAAWPESMRHNRDAIHVPVLPATTYHDHGIDPTTREDVSTEYHNHEGRAHWHRHPLLRADFDEQSKLRSIGKR